MSETHKVSFPIFVPVEVTQHNIIVEQACKLNILEVSFQWTLYTIHSGFWTTKVCEMRA